MYIYMLYLDMHCTCMHIKCIDVLNMYIPDRLNKKSTLTDAE